MKDHLNEARSLAEKSTHKGLAMISDALTTQYLWPALIAAGMPEDQARQFVVECSVEPNVPPGRPAVDEKEGQRP